MMISMGASAIETFSRSDGGVYRTARTNKGEHMPGEVTDSIYVSGHEGHNLRLAREIVFVRFFLFSGRRRTGSGSGSSRVILSRLSGGWRWGRCIGCNICPHKILRIQN